ncbi:MAG TPA: penicillin acylase family protein [Blastocatellia bacterium]|nr:penicillin acylase family protein [Blastocatellia bacterium]
MRHSVIALVCVSAMLAAFTSESAQPLLLKPSGRPGESQVLLPGLLDPVTISIDSRGTPYVQARNDDDLYFAQGYVVARDRLWQMDLLRRMSRGQLAEIFGKAALESDKIHRTYGFGQLADQMIPLLEPKARAAIDSYSRGVNAFISSLNDQTLPVEFRVLRYKPSGWQPSDCVLLGKMFAETLSSSWRYDLVRAVFSGIPEEKRRRIFQTKSPADVLLVGKDKPILPSSVSLVSHPALPSRNAVREALEQDALEEVWLRISGLSYNMHASNNWVVSGQHTASGKPMLANDPHLSPSAPSIWYMISLSAPGIHCEGVTVPGAPGVFIGHNDSVAWGITNVEADVQDVFLERFDQSNPQRYQAPDGWRDATIRHEEIKIRKVPLDPATEPLAFEVTTTRHGPIVLDKGGQRYALAWPALDASSKELEVYYDIDRARSCRELEAVLRHYTGFPLNFVYADVAGHIGWWAQGRYPTRKSGRGSVPQEGWTDAGDWTGYVPLSDTPHVYDPRSGIIVTANSRTVGDSYPYYLGDLWAEPYRARRIFDFLTARNRLGINDFEEIQGDIYSVPGAIFANEVVGMAEAKIADSNHLGHEADSSEWAALLAIFENWNGNAAADSRAMLLVGLMRRVFITQILRSAFGPELSREYSWPSYALFDDIVRERQAEWLPSGYKSYPDFILACYHQALGDMKKALGADESKWRWGEFAKVHFAHPLSAAPFIGSQFDVPAFPQNGSTTTINNGSNVSMRFIADLSNWDNARLGIPLGESGDPKSPHWKDQLDNWRNVTPATFAFSLKGVDSASVQKLTLKALSK